MAGSAETNVLSAWGHRRRRAIGLAAAALVCALAHAAGAQAQVIEISPDGAPTTYAAPAVFTDAGVQPIQSPSRESPAIDVRRVIAEAAGQQNLSVELVSAVAWRESGFRQGAVSPKNAVGIMQLTAGTARALGVDRLDARQNIHGGAAYLRTMLNRYSGDVRLALAAYNAGPGAVDRYGGVPPYRETQAYVADIVERLSQRAAAEPAIPFLIQR